VQPSTQPQLTVGNPFTMCSHGRPVHAGTAPTRHSYPELGTGPGAKWSKGLIRDRTRQFTGGRYSSLNLSAVMFMQRFDDKDHVELKVWSAPGRSKPSFHEAMSQSFKPAHKGDSFGPSCKFF
jgi:alpha-mannosidase